MMYGKMKTMMDKKKKQGAKKKTGVPGTQYSSMKKPTKRKK
tara:strand:- start:1050 stop:1172 length:123 start_codon:yes stop_codon:yes gene_type:complete